MGEQMGLWGRGSGLLVGAKERGCTSRAAEERAAVRVALGLLRDLGGVSGDPRLLQAHNRGWGMW